MVNANTYQAATLNKLLPPGFKIDLEEVVQKNIFNRKNLAQSIKNTKQNIKKKKVNIEFNDFA